MIIDDSMIVSTSGVEIGDHIPALMVPYGENTSSYNRYSKFRQLMPPLENLLATSKGRKEWWELPDLAYRTFPFPMWDYTNTPIVGTSTDKLWHNSWLFPVMPTMTMRWGSDQDNYATANPNNTNYNQLLKLCCIRSYELLIDNLNNNIQKWYDEIDHVDWIISNLSNSLEHEKVFAPSQLRTLLNFSNNTLNLRNLYLAWIYYAGEEIQASNIRIDDLNNNLSTDYVFRPMVARTRFGGPASQGFFLGRELRRQLTPKYSRKLYRFDSPKVETYRPNPGLFLLSRDMSANENANWPPIFNVAASYDEYRKYMLTSEGVVIANASLYKQLHYGTNIPQVYRGEAYGLIPYDETGDGTGKSAFLMTGCEVTELEAASPFPTPNFVFNGLAFRKHHVKLLANTQYVVNTEYDPDAKFGIYHRGRSHFLGTTRARDGEYSTTFREYYNPGSQYSGYPERESVLLPYRFAPNPSLSEDLYALRSIHPEAVKSDETYATNYRIEKTETTASYTTYLHWFGGSTQPHQQESFEYDIHELTQPSVVTTIGLAIPSWEIPVLTQGINVFEHDEDADEFAGGVITQYYNRPGYESKRTIERDSMTLVVKYYMKLPTETDPTDFTLLFTITFNLTQR